MDSQTELDSALFAELYEDLKQRAQTLRRAAPKSSLTTTAMVHEAYLKLYEGKYRATSRSHLFRTAAMAMQQILLDQARRQKSEKHGSGAQHITLSGIELPSPDAPDQLFSVISALERLRALDARLADTFALRAFAGLSLEEIGELQGVSHMTCSRDFQTARAYLLTALDPQ